MKHLFAYGTLMCPEIMKEVSGDLFPNSPGVLNDYRRFSLKGEAYPAVVHDVGSSVAGIVYRNVSPKALKRLDRFEGELYKRQSVAVTLDEGTSLRVEVYVLRPRYASLLGNADWNFADFLKRGKTRFSKQYKGFLQL